MKFERMLREHYKLPGRDSHDDGVVKKIPPINPKMHPARD